MATLELKTKRFLITTVKKGKPNGHPIYVEKSIFFQIWEKFIYPFLILLIGIAIGVVFE